MSEKLVFGYWTFAQLDKAREIAVEVMKLYGDLTGDEYERFLANPWNDHCSVQTALRAMPKASEVAAERERSLKLVGLLRHTAQFVRDLMIGGRMDFKDDDCPLCLFSAGKHADDCLITQLKAAADDLTQPVSGEGGGK
jgi:hypothetical protein